MQDWEVDRAGRDADSGFEGDDRNLEKVTSCPVLEETHFCPFSDKIGMPLC